MTSAHLIEQWRYLDEKISVSRLNDIYEKADELEVDSTGYAKAAKTKTLKPEEILNAVVSFYCDSHRYKMSLEVWLEKIVFNSRKKAHSLTNNILK